MSFIVWLTAYFGLYFAAVEPVFHPRGFGETFAAVVICWFAAKLVEGFYKALVD